MIVDKEDARAFVSKRCNAEALERLECLASNLKEENERQNLVAAATVPIIWQRHIADSAQLLDHVPREKSRAWLDLGTGAGFPGLVIAVMRPELPTVLVESRAKRVAWLMRMVDCLGLNNCRIEGVRLESLPTFHAGVISARAFSPLPKLIDLSRRFSTRDTAWLLPKGRSAAQEVADLPKRLQKLFHVKQSLTDSEAGIVVGSGLEATKP